MDSTNYVKKSHHLLDSVKSNGTNQGILDLGAIFAQKKDQRPMTLPPTLKGNFFYMLSLIISSFKSLYYHMNPCAKPNKRDAAIGKMLVSEDYCARRKSQILISHLILLCYLLAFLVIEYKSRF